MKTSKRVGALTLVGSVLALGATMGAGGCKQIIGWEAASDWDGGAGATGTGATTTTTTTTPPKPCTAQTDCTPGTCTAGFCAPASCTDGVQDGNETDVDCGGSCTTKCGDGKKCSVDGDCVNDDCYGGTCVSCTDGVQDGNETDVDCGGSCTTKCTDGKKCVQNGDCASDDCSGGVCISCMDGKKNGNETDVDCGGPTCPQCAFDKMCMTNSDCLTEFCVTNACGAFNLATGQTNPTGITVDSASVYWANYGLTGPGSGSIAKVATTGGMVTTLATGLFGPEFITVSGTLVIWSSGQTIQSVPLGGGSAATVASGLVPNVVFVDPGGSNFVDFLNTGTTSNAIDTVTYTGTGNVAQPAFTLSTSVLDFAVDTTSFYWLDSAAGTVTKSKYGTQTTLASGQPGPTLITVDDANVYWSNGGSKTIASVPLAGGTPTTVVTNVNAGALRASPGNGNVYWLEGDGVYKAPSAGGAAVLIANGTGTAFDLALDATYAYWTSRDGTVWKAKR